MKIKEPEEYVEINLKIKCIAARWFHEFILSEIRSDDWESTFDESEKEALKEAYEVWRTALREAGVFFN